VEIVSFDELLMSRAKGINGQDKEQVGFPSSMQARHTGHGGEF